MPFNDYYSTIEIIYSETPMFTSIKNCLQNYALHKTRAQLLTMTDRQLEDVGISRDLLLDGVTAWPWREDVVVAELTAQPENQPERMSAKAINRAIRDLSSMSDKDLRDIGIDRGTIRQSVIDGAPRRATRDTSNTSGPKEAA